AAEQAISSNLPSGSDLPTASLVAIDNKTGEVRAMVGGPIVNGQEDFKDSQFNLATQGHRQPGSAFKPFTLAAALQSADYSPVSSNYAMILGGLKIGVTPLDMAHAYETLAMHGQRVYPSLGALNGGPTGIDSIQCSVCQTQNIVNHPSYQRVLPAPIAQTVHDI